MRPTFWALAVATLAYAVVFPLITIDALVYLFKKAPAYERSNFLFVVFLELSRLVTTLIGVTVAGYLLARKSSRADARSLALFLLFATITYEKTFGGGIVPGPWQERTTLALIGMGAAPQLLKWMFGPEVWTAWPAIAALLRFSVVFPGELDLVALQASARQDRRGFLRGTGVAGADIGASMRSLSGWLVRRNAFAPLILSVCASAMIVLHVAFADSLPWMAFWAIALLAVFIAVTNVRASYLEADESGRVRVAWVTLGLVTGLFMFVISAAAYILIAPQLIRALAFGMMMLVPAVVMAFLALSVSTGDRDMRSAVHGAVRAGTIALAMIVVLAAFFAAGQLAQQRFGVPGGVAALAAVSLTALAYVPVRRAADAVRRRVLEDGTNDV